MSFAARLAHRGAPPRAEEATPGVGERCFAQRLAARGAWSSPGFERQVFTVRSDSRSGSRSGCWDAAAPLPARLDALEVPGSVELGRAVRVVRGDDAAGPSDRGAVVLDLETTGLGSAARALAFIVGIARVREGGSLQLVQWTLLEPAAERSMLRDVSTTLRRDLDAGSTLLTFNGASFDVPLLQGRLRRLGLEPPAVLRDAPHLDLLHVARRLGGSDLPDHRLSTLERVWLGIDRVGDLDGAEVARVFEQLVRAPGAPWVRERLDQARAHNRLDLVASTVLACRLARLLEGPHDLAMALRAARHFRRCDRPARALACLLPFARAGGADDPVLVRQLADLLRRLGAPDAAARLWSWLCVRCPGDVEAHEALAKDLEHRRRRPAQALGVAQASSSPCPRRIARLRRKVERQQAAATEPAVRAREARLGEWDDRL